MCCGGSTYLYDQWGHKWGRVISNQSRFAFLTMMRFFSRGCGNMVNKNKSTCICDVRNFASAYWGTTGRTSGFCHFLGTCRKDVYATWHSGWVLCATLSTVISLLIQSSRARFSRGTTSWLCLEVMLNTSKNAIGIN